MRLGHASSLLALVAVGVSVVSCGSSAGVPRAPFSPKQLGIAHDVRLIFATRDAPGAPGLHHYEYVFPDRLIDVYDIDRGHRLVAQLRSRRLVAAQPRRTLRLRRRLRRRDRHANEQIVAFLPALYNSRYQLEIDWNGRRTVRTSTRSGIGYPSG
jgi:hypothetical protein